MRLTTLLLALGFGVYACGIVAVVLQIAWTRGLAAVTDTAGEPVRWRWAPGAGGSTSAQTRVAVTVGARRSDADRRRRSRTDVG